MASEKKYQVIKAVWLRGIQRHPGYILTSEDIGFKTKEGIKHLLELKAIKEI